MTKTLCCLKVFESIYNHSSLRTKFSKLIKKTQTNTKKKQQKHFRNQILLPLIGSLSTHTPKREDTRNSGQLIDHSMN